jgi:voltage-gated potassium channel
MKTPLRQIRLPLLTMALLLLGGTAAYMHIEGWRVIDALYMTVIILSTVGMGLAGMRELSPGGEIFTIFLILFGVTTIAWAVENVVEIAFSHDLRAQFRRRQMEARIRKMRDHYIVCGYGRMGHQIVAEFQARKIPFVVIESVAEVAAQLETDGIACIAGNATEEESLRAAGVEHAKGLVTVVTTDADNLFIVLTAKQMNPKLYAVTRCADESSHAKLKRAGADRVVSPYVMGGRRMVTALLHPTVVDFIDTLLHSQDIDLEIGEFHVTDDSEFLGKTIAESRIHKETGAFIIAVKTSKGGFVPTPAGSTPIEKGSTLIAVGTMEQLENLARMVVPERETT